MPEVKVKLDRHSHSKEANKFKQNRKNLIKTEMTESKGIQAIVNQATTAVVMVLRETEAVPRPGASTAIPRVVHRQRHGSPVLKYHSVYWK